MGFMGFLNSLDELLYEVMSWLVFFPLTLWRAVRHPLRMMRYADTELKDAPEDQYREALSPPLFLLIALLLAHLFEVAMVGDSPLIHDRAGLAGYISNDTDLLALRMVSFAIFPLMLSLRALRSTKQPITRESLKKPFYAQCYATAPMALLVSIATTCSRTEVRDLHLLAMVLGLGGVAWFMGVEIAWFRRVHGQHGGRAFANTAIAYAEAIGILIVAGALLL